MSNEKPVRITVGDVKEVAEATAIQNDTPVAKSVSAVSYTASKPDTSGMGGVYLAGLVGLAMVGFSGYLGFINSEVKPVAKGETMKAAISTSAAMADANNAPSNVTTGPADKAVSMPPVDSNTPAANNAPAASNNAPAEANNAPAAANNTP